MDNDSLEIFNRYNEVISRYVELFNVKDIEKLETSLVIISRSIQDIKMKYDSNITFGEWIEYWLEDIRSKYFIWNYIG